MGRAWHPRCLELTFSGTPQILVLPRKDHINHIAALTPVQVQSFASILGEVTLRYDNLFECSFPYSMGIHQRPIPPRASSSDEERQWDEAQLHVHFYPPLLRSKTVKKFQVSGGRAGACVCGGPQLTLALCFRPPAGGLRNAWRAATRSDGRAGRQTAPRRRRKGALHCAARSVEYS